MNLLVGTVLLRPYVFAFLALFLAAGAADLGWRRTLRFAAAVWPLAWLAEFASTRTGVPFGRYHYTGLTRGQELYLADVPFMDSLSFTFLAYASFCLARAGLRGRSPARWRLAAAAGLCMMVLDVVIDPLAVRGDRWFLGPIFAYAEPGPYFGVPLANFGGWWLVGTLGVAAYLGLEPRRRAPAPGRDARAPAPGGADPPGGGPWGRRVGPGVALYYAVLAFNLAVTAWIGEWALLAAGLAVHAALAAALWRLAGRGAART